MTRAEERMLIRAVFEIGRKVAALPLPDHSTYDNIDAGDLLRALHPLRAVVDEYDREEKKR